MTGGRGVIAGSFLGAIMLQMIEGILIIAKIPPFLNGLVKGVIIIFTVLLQHRSVLKRKKRLKTEATKAAAVE
jgi:ribose transport system permease protein